MFERFESLEELLKKYPKKEKHYGKDYTGEKYNRLEFITRVEHPDKSHSYWAVKCDCGKYFVVINNSITSGRTKSCGCLNAELSAIRAHETFFKDLTGNVYGKLKVIKFVGQDTSHHCLWECKCECGNTTIVSSSNLTTYHTMSCGCNKQSNGELLIEQWLQEHNFKYEKEVKVPELGQQRFDFKIYHNSYYVFLEMQGIQHYQAVKHFGGEEGFAIRQQHDQDKVNYCKQYNIPLIIIKYNQNILQQLEQSISSTFNDQPKGVSPSGLKRETPQGDDIV